MPPVPQYSADDYAAALARLLPPGEVWPRDQDATLMAVMAALSPTYARNHADAAALLADIFPPSTDQLIPEWEETLGLPDPCTPLNPSTEQRRAAIVTKFIGSGGQSIPYFISIAAALGFTVTVTEYVPFRAGRSRAGDPDYGAGWAYVWAINAALNTIVPFRAGQSAAGDPLRSWGNAEMECRLTAIKPAHTVLLFVYS